MSSATMTAIAWLARRRRWRMPFLAVFVPFVAGSFALSSMVFCPFLGGASRTFCPLVWRLA
jgi:hypothetical protein